MWVLCPPVKECIGMLDRGSFDCVLPWLVASKWLLEAQSARPISFGFLELDVVGIACIFQDARFFSTLVNKNFRMGPSHIGGMCCRRRLWRIPPNIVVLVLGWQLIAWRLELHIFLF